VVDESRKKSAFFCGLFFFSFSSRDLWNFVTAD